MNLLADESVDGPIVERLRRDGHRVWYVAEMEPGISDKDFGELVFRQRRLMPGVMLIRLAGLSPTEKARIVASVITSRGADLPQAFTVIAPRMVRVRLLR